MTMYKLDKVYEMNVCLTNVCKCGPRILAQCVSHSNGELEFYFEKLVFIDYLKMTWSRHLFLFYF